MWAVVAVGVADVVVATFLGCLRGGPDGQNDSAWVGSGAVNGCAVRIVGWLSVLAGTLLNGWA